MDYNTAITMASGINNYAVSAPEAVEYQPKKAKSRRGSHQPSIDKLYAKLTAEGIKCKIVRERGKAPKLVMISG